MQTCRQREQSFWQGQYVGIPEGWLARSDFSGFGQFLESLFIEAGYVSIGVKQAQGWKALQKLHW
jgi:hypothetical protein